MEIKVIVNGMLKENTYILIKDNKSIIIDPGSNVNKIVNEVGETTPVAVLLTHGHYDHIEGLKGVISKFPVKTYIHEIEMEQVKDNDFNCSKFFARDFKFPDVELVGIKEGNLEIENFKFDVLHTPGHTTGGVCFLTNNHLIAGDTLFKESHGRIDLPTGSMYDMRKSLRYLSTLDNNIIVYPGHGPKTTIGDEEYFMKNI